MVALRLIAERDTEMVGFTPQTVWRASVTFLQNGVRFRAPVLNAKGTLLTLRSEAQARQLEVLLRTGIFWIEQTGQTLQTLPAPVGSRSSRWSSVPRVIWRSRRNESFHW